MRLIQKAAVVLGGAYLLVGVAGFAVTGFDGWLQASGDQLLLFSVNPFHNLVHIVVGGLWLLGAWLTPRGAVEGVFLGIGAVYGVAAALGFLGALPILGIEQALSPVNFLHLGTAVAAVAIGVLLGDWSQRSAGTAGERAGSAVRG